MRKITSALSTFSIRFLRSNKKSREINYHEIHGIYFLVVKYKVSNSISYAAIHIMCMAISKSVLK